jgi:DNA-binding CsgD family transcriptional regulator
VERLGPADYEGVLAFLHGLYAVDRPPAFPQQAMLGIAGLIPCDVLSYNEIDPHRQRASMVMEPVDAVTPAAHATFQRLQHQHPLINHYARSQDGGSRKISDFLSLSQFQRLELHHEFFRPMRIDYQMAVTIPSSPEVVIGIALNRIRSDFSGRDRAVLDVIRPHLDQAYRNTQARSDLAERLAGAERALEAADRAIVLLTRDRRIKEAGPRARLMLAGHAGAVKSDGSRLPTSLDGWVRGQSSIVGLVPPDGSRELTLHSERGRLHVRFVAAANGQMSDALVLWEERVPVKQVGELSPREAEVLEWVAQGKTNAEIGGLLGVSPRTVQKHLEHVYDKLGVRSRAAAAIRLADR